MKFEVKSSLLSRVLANLSTLTNLSSQWFTLKAKQKHGAGESNYVSWLVGRFVQEGDTP